MSRQIQAADYFAACGEAIEAHNLHLIFALGVSVGQHLGLSESRPISTKDIDDDLKSLASLWPTLAQKIREELNRK